MSAWLRDAIATMPSGDDDAAALVAERAAQVLRPPGALARLDEVAVWVARWQRTAAPAVSRPACLVFAADHGVARDAGVSAYPTEVTGAMLAAVRAERATINALARVAGATVDVIDVGVGNPTADIRSEPALDEARFDAIVAVARAAVDRLDADLLVLGELGIGNTTAAAAIAAAICGGDVADWVGRGAGVDDDGLERKRAAVKAAVARIAGTTNPIEILREVGGAELVAMSAAIVAARHRRLPIVLDGYLAGTAALPLHTARPDALDHCIAGHQSAEPGHRLLLDRFGLDPLLDLGMRLGEGSGAMAAVPLVAMACAAVVEVPTFGEWFG